MNKYLWRIKEVSSRVEELAEKFGLSPFLIQIFFNREVKEKEFTSFLNPKSDDLHSPLLLPDIKLGAERIKKAIERGEKVLVFGDYDVDGITSLAIFHEFAKKFPQIFSFYIPHRIKEGYGLNKEVVLKAKEEGVNLIVAFDCGSRAIKEIKLAKSFKIDIIVVDHHHTGDELIEPLAFINPKRKDSEYPFLDLSAAAISFKLLQVLTDSLFWEALDLVALSLVCDVVPLKGENRVLLKKGLKIIKRSPRLAIKALCESSGIRQEYIDTFHIGYILGPRINASGRVAHAKESLELFLTEDKARVYNLVSKLGEYNKLRRTIETRILKEAETAVKGNDMNEHAIVVSGPDWHPGVLGIVASRLVNKYYRPSFVFSFNQEMGTAKKIGKGSARSTESVHLIEVLDKCSNFLLLYGGHSRAAGVEIKKEELANFRKKINDLIEENLSPQDFIPAIDIDALLDFKDINADFIEDLEKLKPYGEGNLKPLFVVRNISKKSSPKKIKSYYSLWLNNKGMILEGVVYDKDVLEVINNADSFDIAFSLQMNYYHNTPKLIIRDCRLSGRES